jgi:hypothetical protein
VLAVLAGGSDTFSVDLAPGQLLLERHCDVTRHVDLVAGNDRDRQIAVLMAAIARLGRDTLPFWRRPAIESGSGFSCRLVTVAGAIAIPTGLAPARIGVSGVLVEVAIGVTELSVSLTTYAVSRRARTSPQSGRARP